MPLASANEALSPSVVSCTERHALIQLHMLADIVVSPIAAGAVIDEEVLADLRPWMSMPVRLWAHSVIPGTNGISS